MPDGQARLEIYQNDEVIEIFEAEPKKVRTKARNWIDHALKIERD